MRVEGCNMAVASGSAKELPRILRLDTSLRTTTRTLEFHETVSSVVPPGGATANGVFWADLLPANLPEQGPCWEFRSECALEAGRPV